MQVARIIRSWALDWSLHCTSGVLHVILRYWHRVESRTDIRRAGTHAKSQRLPTRDGLIVITSSRRRCNTFSGSIQMLEYSGFPFREDT